RPTWPTRWSISSPRCAPRSTNTSPTRPNSTASWPRARNGRARSRATPWHRSMSGWVSWHDSPGTTYAGAGVEGVSAVQVIDRAKARIDRAVGHRPWLEHLIRTAGRYRDRRGDHYAAGITYFTVLSLFPLLMVAFAIAGFVLAGNQELFEQLHDKIVENIPGEFGTQVTDLVDSAVGSRGTVGVLGLLTGLWTGLGWMGNLRAALTEQWEGDVPDDGNFVSTKLSDLGALIGLGLALALSLALSAVGSG